MKKIFYSSLSALLISISIIAQDMPVNPFIRIDSTSYKLDPTKFTNGQNLYTADPSAHVWNIDGQDILYVYPSHDMEPAFGCDMMDRYHVFSTTDMVNWTDHGEIFNADSVPWGYTVKNGGRDAKFMWAPDCAYKDGKYYYYFPHPYGYADREGWDNWRIGVAISDYPDKDFKVQDTTLLGLPENGFIDPCIFKDDDGKYYFYYGGSQQCWAAELNDDMVSIKPETLQQMQGLDFFHEGAWIFKRNGIYFMTYPGNNSSLINYVAGQDQLLYATSNNPFGPWTFRGSYLGATGCDTSHGSVVQFNGQWYAFYHNALLSGGRTNLRSVCVDKLYFDSENDSIILPVIQTGEDRPISRVEFPAFVQAENFKNGGEGVAYHDNDAPNTGGINYRLGLGSSVDIASSAEEGLFVSNIETNEWLSFDVKVIRVDTFLMEVRLSSASEGSFHIELNGTTIATVDVPNTGGLNNWQSIFVHNVIIPVGEQTLKLVVDNGGFNLNYMMFTLDDELPIGKTMALANSGKYITVFASYLKGTRLVSAENPLTDREKFLIVDAGDGLIALKNLDNGKYAKTSTTQMTCSSSSINDDNKFYWCILRKDGGYRRIVLKSYTNNKIVQVYANESNRPLRAVSENFGDWEKLIWYDFTPVGNVDIPLDKTVSLYPNPAEDIVKVALSDKTNATIQITDLKGKIILQEKTNYQTETNINIDGLPAGLYLVKVISDEFNVVKKLVVI